jgi:hypothetical protein
LQARMDPPPSVSLLTPSLFLYKLSVASLLCHKLRYLRYSALAWQFPKRRSHTILEAESPCKHRFQDS